MGAGFITRFFLPLCRLHNVQDEKLEQGRPRWTDSGGLQLSLWEGQNYSSQDFIIPLLAAERPRHLPLDAILHPNLTPVTHWFMWTGSKENQQICLDEQAREGVKFLQFRVCPNMWRTPQMQRLHEQKILGQTQRSQMNHKGERTLMCLQGKHTEPFRRNLAR